MRKKDIENFWLKQDIKAVLHLNKILEPEEYYLIGRIWFAIIEQQTTSCFKVVRVDLSNNNDLSLITVPESEYETVSGARFAILNNISISCGVPV